MESASTESPVLLVTGARKGIGEFLAGHYLERGYRVVGCSRQPAAREGEGYRHFCLDVADETAVRRMFAAVADDYGRLDVLINNAGLASMNHLLLTPAKKVRDIFETNFTGTFLMCREAARLMRKRRFGRVVNMASVAAPLKLEGEAVYAASKAAVVSFTQIAARELADFGITVNAVGPTPVATDLIKGVPREKLDALVARQAIRRLGEFRDVANVIDFFIRPESDFVTGQVVYLGGV
ncbi:MAG TPA: SDR family oxidoreductase [Pyrinomonadaceae bacterium]|jgi:3-oxoacyl-[acyl-carrier protein] reductase|nr:SDR family oxidoreductase [Pyrinomonadaceae bacterium]